MDKAIFQAKNEPDPKGHYSQIVIGGPFLFLSGQLPIKKSGDIAEGDIVIQTRQILENMKNMLLEAGASLDKIVKMGVFIDELDNFQGMNDVFKEFFPDKPPARTTIVVKQFPPMVKIEIDAIALI